MLKIISDIKKSVAFVPTVLATLPIRTASQGESFDSKSSLTQNNTPSMPLFDAHLGGFFMLLAMNIPQTSKTLTYKLI